MLCENSTWSNTKTSSKWISCDMCPVWFHGLCQNLQNTEVVSVVKLNKKGDKWFCDSCVESFETIKENDDGNLAQSVLANRKLKAIKDVMNNIAVTLSSNKAEMDSKLEKLEKSYAEVIKQNAESMKKSLEANDSAKELFTKNLELSQMEIRKNNAILYGISEEEGKHIYKLVNYMINMMFGLFYIHIQKN